MVKFCLQNQIKAAQLDINKSLAQQLGLHLQKEFLFSNRTRHDITIFNRIAFSILEQISFLLKGEVLFYLFYIAFYPGKAVIEFFRL